MNKTMAFMLIIMLHTSLNAFNVGVYLGSVLSLSDVSNMTLSRDNKFSDAEVVAVPVRQLTLDQRVNCRFISGSENTFDDESYVYGQINETSSTYTKVFLGINRTSYYKRSEGIYFECLFTSILGKLSH